MNSTNSAAVPSYRQSILLFPFCTIFFWGSIYIYMPILAPYAKIVGGSLQAVGLVMGAYGLSQFLLRIPIGVWSDRLGRRKPFLLLGFIFDGVASVGLILSSNTAMLFLSVLTAGIAASTWVTFTVLFSSYFPIGQIARSMSLILFFSRLAQIISTYAGGAIAEAWSWTAPFYIGGILALIGFLLATGITERHAESGSSASWKGLLFVGRNRVLLKVSLLGILLQFASHSTTFGFTPIYAQQIGASKNDLGSLLFFFMLPGTLAMFISGTYAGRWLQERSVILVGFLMVGVAVFLTPLTSRLGILKAIQTVNGVGVGLIFPLLMGLAIQPFPLAQRATAMGFFQSIYAAGMSLGPLITGWIGEHWGLAGAFILNGVLCLIASFFTWQKIEGTGGSSHT